VRGLNWFSFLCTLLEHLPLKFAFNSIVKPLLFTYYILLWSCRTELSFQDIFMSSTRKKKLGSKWNSRQSVWFSSFFFIKISKVWWPKGFYLILQKEGFFLSSNWPIFALNGKKWENFSHRVRMCKQTKILDDCSRSRPTAFLAPKQKCAKFSSWRLWISISTHLLLCACFFVNSRLNRRRLINGKKLNKKPIPVRISYSSY